MPSKRFTLLLDALTTSRRSVYFCQIGANDGAHNDPIQSYVASGAWHGILVEPVPLLFERLCALYPDRPDLIFENVAIAPADGERMFYYMRESGSASDEDALAIGSFSLAHVMKHADKISQFATRLQVATVPCLSLASLFAKHTLTQLDAFIIDAEGFDWEILQTFPFDQMRPTLMMYEHIHLKPTALAACRALLERQGYLILQRHANSVAVSAQSIASDPLLNDAWQRANAAE